LRVLSLAEQYPGPFATLLLADLGAEVILVERPEGGDPARRFPEFFAALNRNKRSVSLDLKHPAGVRAMRRLARSADVLLEGFRPGVVGRLGLDHRLLRKDNPRLVYVSISGFGQDGPYRDRPAHDITYQAMAGLVEEGVGRERPPYLSLADLTGGLFGAIAALTGLSGRGVNGVGGYYDVSMFDSLLSLLISRLVPIANGGPSGEIGQDPAYGIFPTADGELLSLSVSFEDHFWRRLCVAVGLVNLADLDAAERVARRDELRVKLAAVIGLRTLEDWSAELDEAGVPFGPVQTPSEILSAAHVAARGLMSRVPGEDTRLYMRQPLIVDGSGPGPTLGVPELGEATTEILVRAGFSNVEVAALLRQGAARAIETGAPNSG
jgi:crotonobetainyl-CoA:carnitine CoA-transferase CaiB-like acyl-CoA transferase